MDIIINPTQWDRFIANHPAAHLLQTSAWGELKARFGWKVVHIATGEEPTACGAQVLFRRLPFGYSLAYLPKGPVDPQGSFESPDAEQRASAWECLLPGLDALCKQQRAVFLKVEPDKWEPANTTSTEGNCLPPDFRPSTHSIQPQRTLVVKLNDDDERILGRMKQKTRYNIKLAQKKGVVVRPYTDFESFHQLMLITGRREGFGVHTEAYYRQAYELFHPRAQCELLVAEYDGEPLASLMVFAHSKRSWYLYGASGNEHRERMPTYLLQWEAMRWARAQGCTEYDLWGVPDADEEELEKRFTERSDGLWGVYRFKRGFGGILCRAAGPWDRIYNPALYWFYRYWLRLRRSEG